MYAISSTNLIFVNLNIINVLIRLLITEIELTPKGSWSICLFVIVAPSKYNIKCNGESEAAIVA